MQSKLSSVCEHRKQAELIKWSWWQVTSALSYVSGETSLAEELAFEELEHTRRLDTFQKLDSLKLRVLYRLPAFFKAGSQRQALVRAAMQRVLQSFLED